MKYIIGIIGLIIASILLFPLILYVDMVYIPDPIGVREKEAIKDFNYIMKSDRFSDHQDVEIINLELRETTFNPYPMTWFYVHYEYKNKNSKEIKNGCLMLGVTNQHHIWDWSIYCLPKFQKQFPWCYLY